MADAEVSLDVDVAEMLFDAMRRSRVDEYVGDLMEIPDIDVKNASQRTMLHQAVRLGKSDWVRRLLDAVADPSAQESDGRTALDLAKEMTSKHPGETSRKDVLDLIQSAMEGGDSRRRKCPPDGDASKGTRELIPKLVKELWSMLSIELTSLKETISETLKKSFNEDVSNIRRSLEFTEREISAIKKSMSAAEINSRQYYEELKRNNKTELSNILEYVKQSHEGLKSEMTITSSELKTEIEISKAILKESLRKLIFLEKETFRRSCIDGMMRKTEILPVNESNKLKMRTLFEKMYDEDPILTCILQYLHFQKVSVAIDFDSSHIGRMNPKFASVGKGEVSGSDFKSLFDPSEQKVTVAGNLPGNECESNLALNFSKLAVSLAFKNDGRPYFKDGGKDQEKKFKEILEEAERKKRGGEELDYTISTWALEKTNYLLKERGFYAAVPYMIARDGSSKARSTLTKQIPSLLDFYGDRLLVTLREEIKKEFSRGHGLFE